MALLASAERIALADMPWLPIRFLSQSEAVGPRVGGYVQNRRDYNDDYYGRPAYYGPGQYYGGGPTYYGGGYNQGW